MSVANTTYRAGYRVVLAALALSALGFAGTAQADSDDRRGGYYAPSHVPGWVHAGERHWRGDRDYREGYREGWRDGRHHWRDHRGHWRDDRRHWREHDRRWRDGRSRYYDRRYYEHGWYDRGGYAPRHGWYEHRWRHRDHGYRYWKPGHHERWPRRRHDDGDVSLIIRVPL